MERNPMTSDILAQWSAEPWAMEPTRLRALFAALAHRAPALEVLSKIEIDRAPARLDVRDGVAHVPVHGVLLTRVPAWMKFFGIDATAYGDIARLVTEAAASATVTSIQLDVDSPGGTVAGVLTAARAIQAAREAKPITAQVTTLAASAAYWLASQAQEIAADINDEIGSIGVYTVYYDFSKMVENDGVKVHVIASGEHKGMGVDGAPITESQIAAMREVIEGIAENFVAAVATGRGLDLESARALATGRLWEAKAALPLQLIDRLGPAGLTEVNGKSSIASEGDVTMSEESKEKTVAVDVAQIRSETAAAERQRLAALKAAFPDDPAFALDQFESGADVTEAKAAYCDVLAQRLQARKSEKPAEKPTEESDEYRHGGYADGGRGTVSPQGFLAAVRSYTWQHKCTRVAAIKAVKDEQPELYDAFRAEGRPPTVHGACKRVAV
jgi:signal peptide peptidase SppA